MPSPEAVRPKAPRPALKLVVIFGLLLVLGTATAWLLARLGAQRPVRVLLVTPAPDPGAGLDLFECRAIGSLVQDHLEAFGGFAVTSLTELPGDPEPLRRHPRTRILVLEPRRRGQTLALGFREARAGRLLAQGDRAWRSADAPFLSPLGAFEVLDRELGLSPPNHGAALTPAEPGTFWDLTRAAALRLQNDHLEEATTLAERVTRADPRCASGWVLLGNLQYRRYLNNPRAFRSDQAGVEQSLERALAEMPGHPRAAFLLSLIKSDSGDQRGALDLLIAARRIQPRNPTLLTGLAYAARGAGLLPLARRAMDLRDSLAFSEYLPQAVDITCLYTGEIPRFEASLQDRPGHLRNMTGVLPFYRGYLAFLRGQHDVARREFETAREASRGYPNIVRLAEVYVLILDDRTTEAWLKLRAFDQERTGVREPDGEFTLRLAEAYAQLGDRSNAMDMATQAFARGFGCTAWYESSPLLVPLRDLPKWKALLQHLRERQSLMEAAFPPSLVEDPS